VEGHGQIGVTVYDGGGRLRACRQLEDALARWGLFPAPSPQLSLVLRAGAFPRLAPGWAQWRKSRAAARWLARAARLRYRPWPFSLGLPRAAVLLEWPDTDLEEGVAERLASALVVWAVWADPYPANLYPIAERLRSPVRQEVAAASPSLVPTPTPPLPATGLPSVVSHTYVSQSLPSPRLRGSVQLAPPPPPPAPSPPRPG
jgi:hypothetical protein